MASSMSKCSASASALEKPQAKSETEDMFRVQNRPDKHAEQRAALEAAFGGPDATDEGEAE